MPRKGEVPKREVVTDPKYTDQADDVRRRITKFINTVMSKGKKSTAEGIFYSAMDLVESRTGQPTLLYLTQEFDDAYQVSANFNRPLWLRRIILEPKFGSRPWTLWQASNFRRLNGINGRVDWNVARLTWPPQPPHSKP